MTQEEHKAAYDTLHYPGSEPRVLLNNYGHKQEEMLGLDEAHYTSERYQQPLPSEAREMTADGFKAIHKHLFQDSYDWAGQTRPYASARDASTPFAMPEVIAEKLTAIFDRLHGENNLRGLSASEFAEKAAETIGDLNAAHPFVEGNGRTQRVFLKTLAEQAGHTYEITQADRSDWNNAAKLAFVEFDNAPMAALIEKRITPLVAELEPLAPARRIPDLTPDEIDVAVNSTCRVSEARDRVLALAETVHGNRAAYDSTLSTIDSRQNAARALGEAADQVARFTPTAVAPLAGAVSRRGPDETRWAAVAAAPYLADAIREYGHARADTARDLVRDHRILQKKAAHEIPAPSVAYAQALKAPRPEQAALFGSQRTLRDEHAAMTAAYANRLTLADNQSLRAGDTEKLAMSLGVTPGQAAKITQVRTLVTAATPVAREQSQMLSKQTITGAVR